MTNIATVILQYYRCNIFFKCWFSFIFEIWYFYLLEEHQNMRKKLIFIH